MKYLKQFKTFENNKYGERPDWAKGLELEDFINDPKLANKFLAEVYKGQYYNSKGQEDKEHFLKTMQKSGFKKEDIESFLDTI